MKAVFDHIGRVKEKPHHVRKKIAFAYAGVGAGAIALVWLAGSLSLGAFAITGASFADAGGEPSTSGGNGGNALAGVAAAGAKSEEPRIEIIDTTPTTAPTRSAEQTTLPF